MKAVVAAHGAVKVVDRPRPVRPGEALVRVRLAGLCGTDLEIVRGYAGFRGILGHEFVGVVEESESATWVGCRVVGEINVGCGSCSWCRGGLERHCPERTVLGIVGRDGAFAEWLTLPERNLHEVPEAVPDEAAVLTEPLAAAYEILEQTRPEPGTRVLVVGDGRLGQLCAAALHRAGCRVTVRGKHRAKLARLERLGLETRMIDARSERAFDLVVEATGRPAGLRDALAHSRPRGTIVLKSTYHGEHGANLTALVVDEVTLVGSRCGPFPPALRHLTEHPEDVEGLVSARFPLERATEAFAAAMQPGSLKVLLEP